MNTKRIILIAISSAALTTALILALVLPLASRVMAQPQAGAPTVISYQGYLTDINGAPLDGNVDLYFRIYTAQSGGTIVWEEEHTDVMVSGGFFVQMLGEATSLTAEVFGDTSRWLQISVDTGSGYDDLPRQQLTSVPYALQAQQAPWSGLSNVPAGFADDLDGVEYANMIVVAKSGGDYATIQAAIESISDASDTNRYLIWVAPGIYEEQVTMKPYVDIKGSGINTTKITWGGSTAANTGTLMGSSDCRLSFLTVENTGGEANAVGIYTASTSRFRLLNVYVAVSGATQNYGIHSTDSQNFSIGHSTVIADGGSSTYGIYSRASSSSLHSGISISYSYVSGRNGTNNYGVYSPNDQATSSDVKVLYTRVVGDTNTVYNSGVATNVVNIAMSQLDGGSVSASPAGSVKCAGVYDEDYIFFAYSDQTCP